MIMSFNNVNVSMSEQIFIFMHFSCERYFAILLSTRTALENLQQRQFLLSRLRSTMEISTFNIFSTLYTFLLYRIYVTINRTLTQELHSIVRVRNMTHCVIM